MRELEMRHGSARFNLHRGHGFVSRVISDKNWGWRIWGEDRLAMRSLSSPTGFNGAAFKKILQECKDAQFTYLDNWVSGMHCENVEFEEGI